MTGAELAAAREWLEALHPMTDHRTWADRTDALVAVALDLYYEGGIERFVEDLAQASAVS